MIAVCRIRPLPHYRRDAFEGGLKRAGYSLVESGKPSGPGDLLIIWNRYGAGHQLAHQWEASGGTVLVCENGYAGKDKQGHQYYAMAAHGHNGSGWWPAGTEDRFAQLGVDVKPWVDRPDGYALICGQRGIGSPTMASPPNWHIEADRYIRKHRAASTKLRLHPGNHAAKVPLDDDLAGAKQCVIWSSSSGVRALCLGIPVIYDAPHWICADAASRMRASYEYPTDDERALALQRMAHAQWSVEELQSGEPFARFRDELAKRSPEAA